MTAMGAELITVLIAITFIPFCVQTPHLQKPVDGIGNFMLAIPSLSTDSTVTLPR
jgi:ABC-type proline/glycine betaine transport system permease subunit